VAGSGKFELVPVNEITLDRTNPRIARILEMYGSEPTAEQIYLALGAGTEDENSTGPTFEKLKQSIITNGGIIQPVILNRLGNGTIICVEGNTRVSLYKSFIEQKLAGDWQEIPALVHSDIEQHQIDAIRLQAHLVGPRAWDPYAKAKYLNELRNGKHLPWSEIVDYCGGRQKELVESIAAFEDMEKYYRAALEDDTQFDPTRFSGFVELQKSGIKQSILQENLDLYDFAQWVIDEKVYPLNTVRVLPRILKNPEAKKIFLKDGARKAMSILDKPELSKSLQEADVNQLARALVDKLLKITYVEVKKMKQDSDSGSLESLRELQENLVDFLAPTDSD
jgi:hypothetical protein